MKVLKIFSLMIVVAFSACKKEAEDIKQAEIKTDQEKSPVHNPPPSYPAPSYPLGDGFCGVHDSLGVGVNPGEVTCTAYFESWFYNKESNSCEKVGYSACSPSGFQTKSDCEKCVGNDSPPVIDNGSGGYITCTAYFENWFFDKETNSCRKIGYSGCSPRGFDTEEECEACKCR